MGPERSVRGVITAPRVPTSGGSWIWLYDTQQYMDRSEETLHMKDLIAAVRTLVPLQMYWASPRFSLYREKDLREGHMKIITPWPSRQSTYTARCSATYNALMKTPTCQVPGFGWSITSLCLCLPQIVIFYLYPSNITKFVALPSSATTPIITKCLPSGRSGFRECAVGRVGAASFLSHLRHMASPLDLTIFRSCSCFSHLTYFQTATILCNSGCAPLNPQPFSPCGTHEPTFDSHTRSLTAPRLPDSIRSLVVTR
jgi:hypothetical protein